MPSSIEIISYNGVDPSLRQTDFENGVVRARRYRNRRIGGFLKELGLTEGRGTGNARCPIQAIDIDSTLKVKYHDIKYSDCKGFFIGKITNGFWHTLNGLALKQIKYIFSLKKKKKHHPIKQNTLKADTFKHLNG